MSFRIIAGILLGIGLGYIIARATVDSAAKSDAPKSPSAAAIAILADIHTGTEGSLDWIEHFAPELFELEEQGLIRRDYERELEIEAKFPLVRLTPTGVELIQSLFPAAINPPERVERTHCHIHGNTKLVSEPISVIYGSYELTLLGEKYREAEQNLFPNAPRVVHWGVKDSDDTHKAVNVCAICKSAREEWLKKYPRFQEKP